ncbi:MAG: hypothetical protein HYX69_21485 [Planctomycetia bacterium]|nr:hypothetical protein [Planctomycetia bacterium]
MITDVFRRTLWKEYRMLRGFWISVALLTVALQALVWSVGEDPEEAFYYIALVMVTLYALGCAATVFAVEREDGTDEFLRAMPVRGTQLFLPKVTFAIGSTVALFATLMVLTTVVLAGGLWTNVWLISTPPFAEMVPIGITAVEALAWGLFFSLRLKRPLVAACKAAAAGLCGVALVARVAIWSVSAATFTPQHYEFLSPFILGRMLLAAIVFAVDVWLGSRWLPDGNRDGTRREWRSRAGTGRAATGAIPRARITAISRLLWHEWRQSWRTIGVLVAIGVLLSLFTATIHELTPQKLAVPLAVAIVSVMGSCVFLSDQERSQYRFFAERAIRPRMVWLSRHAVWLSAIAAWLLLVVPVWALYAFDTLKPLGDVPHPRPGMETPSLTGSLLEMPQGMTLVVLVALAYACGQLASMLVRRGVVAGFLGLMLTGVVCGWAALMAAFDVNWLLSIAPIPVFLLSATWLRAPHWIGDRNGVWPWTRVALSLAVPAVALATSVAIFRVVQIPATGPGFSPQDYAAACTPAARETQQMYLRAADLFVLDKDPSPTEDAERTILDWPRTIAWLDANREPLELALAASARKECVFGIQVPGERQELYRVGALCLLTSTDARRLTREGELDAAFDRYLAVLRMSVHMRNYQFDTGYGSGWEQNALSRLLNEWTPHPKQTPETIHRALAALEAWDKTVPPPSEAIEARYLYLSGLLSLSESHLAVEERANPAFKNGAARYVFLAKLMPWETARARRVLDRETAIELAAARWLYETVHEGRREAPPPTAYQGFDWARYRTPWLATFAQHKEVLLRAWIGYTAERRAACLLLALEGWRLEHGELPGTLEELEGAYLERLPLDPYSGQDFRYFPHGVSDKLVYRGAGGTIEADAPFVWSAAGAVDGAYAPDAAGFIRWLAAIGNVPTHRDPEYLSHGWAFPIPPPAPPVEQ